MRNRQLLRELKQYRLNKLKWSDFYILRQENNCLCLVTSEDHFASLLRINIRKEVVWIRSFSNIFLYWLFTCPEYIYRADTLSMIISSKGLLVNIYFLSWRLMPETWILIDSAVQKGYKNKWVTKVYHLPNKWQTRKERRRVPTSISRARRGESPSWKSTRQVLKRQWKQQVWSSGRKIRLT